MSSAAVEMEKEVALPSPFVFLVMNSGREQCMFREGSECHLGHMCHRFVTMDLGRHLSFGLQLRSFSGSIIQPDLLLPGWRR